MTEQALSAMQRQIAQLNPQVRVDDAFGKQLSSQVKQRSIPIYVKHLTKDEMIAMIVFYESSAGRVMLEKMPLILGEIVQSSQGLVQDAVRKLLEQSEATLAPQ